MPPITSFCFPLPPPQILVEFTRASGHPHPHQLAMLDYDGLLNKMDIPLAQALEQFHQAIAPIRAAAP